jgi:hypothetical protein
VWSPISSSSTPRWTLTAGKARSRCSSSGSSSSWASAAGALGLTTAACSMVGIPTSTAWPSAARASVGHASIRRSTSTARRRAAGSSPQRRSSSIVPVLTLVERGSVDGSGRRSTTSVEIP